MLKSHKLLATWAAAAVVCTAAAAGASTYGVAGARDLAPVATLLVGAGPAHAQNFDQRVSFSEASGTRASEGVSALDKFRQQRSAILGVPLEEPEQESSSMSTSTYILFGLLAVAIAVIGALIKLMPAGTLRSMLGRRWKSAPGKVSGRVAAARLVGRSDDDMSDGALDEVQEELALDAHETAQAVETQSTPAMPRVQRIVMPTAEAVSRSLVPPGIRRPGGGMANAAQTALRKQAHNREGVPTKADDLSVQRRGLGDRADRMFRELQRFYGFGSRSQLQGLLTTELFQQVEGGLAGQDGSGIPQVLGLIHEVTNVEDAGDHYVGIVAYQATLKFANMPPERSNELFRFVKSKGKGAQYWKLAHIEQLPAVQEAMTP